MAELPKEDPTVESVFLFVTVLKMVRSEARKEPYFGKSASSPNSSYYKYMTGINTTTP